MKNREHTADIAVELWGSSLEELFSAAAEALYSHMELPRCEACAPFAFSETGIDLEDLLVCSLGELLYRADVDGEFAPDVTCELVGRTETGEWEVSFRGAGCRVEGYTSPIKAVTYHDISVREHNERWEAFVVFDV